MIFLITFIIVMVYDYAEFPRTFLATIYGHILHRSISKDSVKLPKLLDCSFCASFWTTLIYQLILLSAFNINALILIIVKSLVCAFLVQHILHLIRIIDELIGVLLDKVEEFVSKNQ